MYASQTPEQKVAIVQRETLRDKTLYVGDGINDAPAMLAATAGIAFGHENAITAEAASNAPDRAQCHGRDPQAASTMAASESAELSQRCWAVRSPGEATWKPT